MERMELKEAGYLDPKKRSSHDANWLVMDDLPDARIAGINLVKDGRDPRGSFCAMRCDVGT